MTDSNLTPPPPSYSAPAPAAPRTNVLATVSLIASLLGLVTGVGFIVGVVCGHISLSQIKKTAEAGHGMALAGVVIGWIGIAFAIIGGIVLATVLASVVTINGTYWNY